VIGRHLHTVRFHFLVPDPIIICNNLCRLEQFKYNQGSKRPSEDSTGTSFTRRIAYKPKGSYMNFEALLSMKAFENW
jgi:hypothetical protein